MLAALKLQSIKRGLQDLYQTCVSVFLHAQCIHVCECRQVSYNILYVPHAYGIVLANHVLLIILPFHVILIEKENLQPKGIKMKITTSKLKSLIKESVREIMSEQTKGVNVKKHINLTIKSDHSFDELPEWVQNARTENAFVSIDSNQRFIWHGGIWLNGEWVKGTWQNGTWQNGTWEKGLWQNGTWKDGTWEHGLWEDGLWEKGSWMGGTWENGTWKNGFWHDGNWKSGIWLNGKWHDKKNPHPNDR